MDRNKKRGIRALLMLTAAAITALLVIAGCNMDEKNAGYSIEAVSFSDVLTTDNFWSGRLKTNREITIPHILQKLEETERIKNFELAAAGQGTFCTIYPFDDTDAYKLIEAASYTLQREYDHELDRRIDALISKIKAIQTDDGYIYSYASLDPNEEAGGAERKRWWYGSERWEKVYLHSHELYNAGHLIEAAVAHYRATGKRNLLDVAVKFADLISGTFGPGPDKRQTIPGHQEIELALVKLYRVTGDSKYLETADFFLKERGKRKYDGDDEYRDKYKQNHKPVKEQSEAVGHSVRAAYMYSGMADVGMLTGDREYIEAIDRIWENIASKKLYLIGGIGSTGHGEGFGANYDLPNTTSYNETCAAIANVLWNFRMFKVHGHARYIDVLERSLYNNVISGVSLEGDRFFYPNRLESDGGTRRRSWFGCACCPPNVARTIASMPQYIYALQGDTVFVNLFVDNTADLELGGQPLQLRQTTDYPWQGTVSIEVNPQQPRPFTVKVRIPGWARNRPVPSDLYRYTDSAAEPEVSVNGQSRPLELQNGYLVLTRTWEPGDRVELRLPMEVRTVAAHDSVEADRGKFAFERGPLVYAAESIDNGPDLLELSLDPAAEFTTEFRPELLNGVVTINRTAFDVQGRERPFTAIPYYGWAHRGDSKMAMWFNKKR